MPTLITSPTNPRVKRVLTLRKPRHRRAAGLLLAEGHREVSRALAAGLEIIELYLCPDLYRGPALPIGDTTFLAHVDAKVFPKMTYHDHPEGLLAVVAEPGWTLQTLSATTADTLVLVAAGTAKPGNLGAMVRTADAAGCAWVLAPGGPAGHTGAAVDRFNPNAIRASTGATFSMPTVTCDDQTAIRFLQNRHLAIVAATPDGGTPHTRADLTGPVAIVIGPEDTGLDDPWLAAADRRVTIAMRPRTVDSLNAANAAAVLLFEALRQRG